MRPGPSAQSARPRPSSDTGDQEAEMSQRQLRGGSHLGSEAGLDFGAPVLRGGSIWTNIAVTSGRSMVWNDARYWRTTIAAAFIVGFLVRGRPGRAVMFMAASEPFVGAGMS